MIRYYQKQLYIIKTDSKCSAIIQESGAEIFFDQLVIGENPAVVLVSDASNFVNDYILYVDGGILIYIGKQPCVTVCI